MTVSCSVTSLEVVAGSNPALCSFGNGGSLVVENKVKHARRCSSSVFLSCKQIKDMVGSEEKVTSRYSPTWGAFTVRIRIQYLFDFLQPFVIAL